MSREDKVFAWVAALVVAVFLVLVTGGCVTELIWRSAARAGVGEFYINGAFERDFRWKTNSSVNVNLGGQIKWHLAQ